MASGSPLFRKQALEYYLHHGEQTILPRLAKPPVFLLLWILLGLASMAMLVIWLGQIPVYVNGSGVVIERMLLQNGRPAPIAMALVVVPTATTHPWHIHAGNPVRWQMGTQGQSFWTTVDVVDPGILNLAEIQRRYQPGNRLASVISGPSTVVWIRLGSAFAAPMYEGGLLSAQIQAGSTSVLSSLFRSV